MNNMNNNLYYNPKKLKKIKNKRTQKARRLWGGILTALGGMELLAAITSFSMSDAMSALFFLIPGLILFIYGTRKVKKWDQYEAIIDNHGNTPLSLIARKMGLPEKTVYSDLQEMILSDFFIGPNCNIEAYVDAERDMLVMASGGQPLRPVPDLPEDMAAKPEEGSSAKADGFGGGAKAGKAASDIPDAEFQREDAVTEEEIREVELTDLEIIQKAITDTKDDEVRGYLFGLEGSVRRIDERIKERPELMEKMSIRRLYKYYLPQIVELISKYQEPDTPADLKKQIKGALQTSAGALANIEADLLEREQMDAEVDIEVLKNMFAQDGLLDRNQRTGGSGSGAQQAQAQAQAAPRPSVQGR